jgi:poly(hydroxyalkanoate) depolymerase family esterase
MVFEAPTFGHAPLSLGAPRPPLCRAPFSHCTAAFIIERLEMQSLAEVIEDVRLGRRPPWPCHPDPAIIRLSNVQASRLVHVPDFGSNPGNLRMLRFIPWKLRSKAPLVVVLHGCGQSARDIIHGAGWTRLANEMGFFLLAPEQRCENNPQRGFNWFRPSDSTRDSGEALSIRRMIDWMISEHGLDRKRVYVTGLSAGAAMTSVLLATYPEVFAGGAIIAGLPFGVAANLVDAIALMKGKLERSSGQLGDEVRAASPHRGPWPKVSIWHGAIDTIVSASNADAITRQWCDVHGLRDDEALQSQVSGQTRRFWRDSSGREVLETFIIPKMGHAVPTSEKGGQGSGACRPFFEDSGISSAFQIAKFWGLLTSPTSKQALRKCWLTSIGAEAGSHEQRLRDL